MSPGFTWSVRSSKKPPGEIVGKVVVDRDLRPLREPRVSERRLIVEQRRPSADMTKT